jgi:hypothetical protein
MEFFRRHPHDRFPSAWQQGVSLSLSQASIPEICQKCDHFAAFIGTSAKYPGGRKGMLMKKREDKRGKERFTMHASLCGGGDLLKALGCVAHYLADGIFYSTNDSGSSPKL